MSVTVEKYGWGLFCAMLVGAVMVLPQIILPLSLGHEYQGVLPLMLDDEDIYRARIHEILDGHRTVASPYLYEYKEDSQVVVPPVNEWLYAIPASLFGLSFTVVASKFVLPSLLFFLVYVLLLRMFRSGSSDEMQLAALSGAFLVVLGTDLVDYHYAIEVLQGNIGQKAMLWERIVNPISGAVELFTFLVLLVSALGGSKKSAVLGGTLLAFMVGYFFSFGLAYCILGTLIVCYVFCRDLEKLKQLFIIVGVSLFLDIPYWWSTFHAISGQEGRLLSARNGMSLTHDPVFNKALIAATIFCVALFWLARQERKKEGNLHQWVFSLSLLAGSWIAFNQQVITGREIWHHHFVQYVVPLSFVSVVIALYFSVRITFPRLWYIGSVGMIVVALSYGLLISWAGALPYREELLRQQDFGEIFTYLDTKSGSHCVVLVHAESETLEKAIPAYTRCDVYSTSYVFIGVPHERVIHNLLLQMRLSGISETDAEEYFWSHEAEVRHVSFTDWDQLFGRGKDEWYIEQVERLRRLYQDFLQKDLKAEMFRYRMDYLVTDSELPSTVLMQLPGLKFDSSVGTFSVYTYSHE